MSNQLISGEYFYKGRINYFLVKCHIYQGNKQIYNVHNSCLTLHVSKYRDPVATQFSWVIFQIMCDTMNTDVKIEELYPGLQV